MIVVHKIALDPNTPQEELFRKSAGCARFADNWALREQQEQSAAGVKLTEGDLRKLLNEIKDDEFPWMRDVSKNVIQQAIKNFGKGFGELLSRAP